MHARYWMLLIGFGVAGIAVAPGCSSTKTKLSSCQRDRDQLMAQVAEQQRLVENLRVQNRAIAAKLAESETLLARIHEQTAAGSRLVNAPSSGGDKTADTQNGWKPSGTK